MVRNESSCRLCEAIVDRHYCKNIFNKKNTFFLSAAEEIFGSPLPRLENFSSLVCRSCERRLTSFKSFQQIIRQSQTSAEMRFKRVIEISPSSSVTATKSSRTNEVADVRSARRGLNFPADHADQSQSVAQGQEVSLKVRFTVMLSLYKVQLREPGPNEDRD